LITAYSELVVQFGHVIMFSSVLPIAGFINFAINWFTYYSIINDFKYKRRTIPTFSLGIGEFSYYLKALAHISIVINCAILVFTSRSI